ncbi:MAG: alpha-ketoglutarate-dependent dioxygenase AlkB [Bifidobacteriaceae bacterium]|jgi:uncharacterized membrane protein YphA (DoxX/SURF4 family)|nr:alpha-ketoglutarate-dependent dioxygenase AlkB [Bifidobacteriaceae bacterium]
MSLIRFKARALIGAATIADGVGVLRNPGPHEEVAGPAIDKLNKSTGQTISAAAAVRANGIALAAGGGLIATSIAPRLGALASLAVGVPALFLGYRFWEVKDDPERRARLQSGFWFRLVLIGADLLILAGPTRRGRKPKSPKAAKSA